MSLAGDAVTGVTGDRDAAGSRKSLPRAVALTLSHTRRAGRFVWFDDACSLNGKRCANPQSVMRGSRGKKLCQAAVALDLVRVESRCNGSLLMPNVQSALFTSALTTSDCQTTSAAGVPLVLDELALLMESPNHVLRKGGGWGCRSRGSSTSSFWPIRAV